MICLSVNENEEHLLMLLIVRCPQSVSKSLCYRWVRRLKGGISFIHFAIERKKERIQELSVHFRQTLEVRWWSQLSFERREEMRQKRCGVKVFAVQILKGPTDLWDKINGDQTLLNFSFNVTPQDDSSEKNSVDWWLWLLHKHIHINTHTYTPIFLFPLHLSLSSRTHTPRHIKSYRKLKYMFIVICQIDFSWMSTQSKPESTHSVCAWFLFSAEHNATFIFAAFSKSGIWFYNMPLSLEVLSIPTVSGFFFFSKTQSCCEVSLRSWKVLFKPQVFAVFTFQLARWI